MNILNKPLDELKKALGTDFTTGLSTKGVEKNTDAFGLNVPFYENGNVLISFFKSLLSDVMPWLFCGICILSFFVQQSATLYASLVLFVIYIFTRLGIYLYINSVNERTLSHRKLNSTVIRNGKKQVINSRLLVPGDILLLSPNDFVPCDCIVIECQNFSVFESFITSKHSQVAKISQSHLSQDDTYHSCIVFAGSAVSGGYAKVLVCHTGKSIFNIENSPFKKVFINEMPKIHKNNLFVGKQLYLLWILMCFVVFTIGVLLKYDVFGMLYTAIALSIAALGDCIPLFSEAIIVSSVRRLEKKFGCIIKNYKSIDTFNSTDTAFIENFDYFLSAMPEIKGFYINNAYRTPSDINPYQRDELLKYAIISMMASAKSYRYTDISLLKYSSDFGITKKTVQDEFVYLNKYSGEIDAVMTFRNGEYSVVSHGFANDMLARCTSVDIRGTVCELTKNMRFSLQNQIHNMEMDSQTVIAVVKKSVDFSSQSQECFVDLDRMTLLGFIGFYNPVSADSVKALSLCKKSGINTVLMENAPSGAYLDMAHSTSLLESNDLTADSESLAECDAGLLRAELNRYKVFSHLSQRQRVFLSRLYKENGNVITSFPTSLSDIPLQAVSDASVSSHDSKVTASKCFSDVILTKKSFYVFPELIKNCRAIYHNANHMLLYVLTSQFYICTLILLGMIFEKRLIFGPPALFLYGIFSIFPCAVALCCDPPYENSILPPPNYNKRMFNLISLIPPPLINGLTCGIVTVLVHRMYNGSNDTASGAALVTMFTSTFLMSISLRCEDIFVRRKLSILHWVSLIISFVALFTVFAVEPLRSALGVYMPNAEVVFISVIFAIIPLGLSEILKKAKNLTK